MWPIILARCRRGSNNWEGWTLALFSRYRYTDGLVTVLIRKGLWGSINWDGKTGGRTDLVGIGRSRREEFILARWDKKIFIGHSSEGVGLAAIGYESEVQEREFLVLSARLKSWEEWDHQNEMESLGHSDLVKKRESNRRRLRREAWGDRRKIKRQCWPMKPCQRWILTTGGHWWQPWRKLFCWCGGGGET